MALYKRSVNRVGFFVAIFLLGPRPLVGYAYGVAVARDA